MAAARLLAAHVRLELEVRELARVFRDLPELRKLVRAVEELDAARDAK